MSYQDDPEGYRLRIEAKLQPENIRATLGFAALYQMTHEMIQDAVLDKVRDFYRIGIGPDGEMTAEEQQRYRTEVLSLVPKNGFKSSLVWLVRCDAITQAQADRLDDIYAHRHAVTHELIKFVIDPDSDLDPALFVDALETLEALHRFWIEVALSTGGFLLPDGTLTEDADAEEVTPLSLMILQQCIDAYLDGLPKPEEQPSA